MRGYSDGLFPEKPEPEERGPDPATRAEWNRMKEGAQATLRILRGKEKRGQRVETEGGVPGEAD